MTVTFDEIVGLLAQRKAEAGPLLARAAEVTAAYNSEIAVPLPELDRNEAAAVPNLLRQGLDQMSMRISSTTPDVFCPPDKPGVQLSEKRARIRRQAHLGWWEASRMKLVLGRRARHLLGYATSPVCVYPDFARGVPAWQLLHPLRSFPAPCANPDDVLPDDVIATFDRTWGWLCRSYPQVRGMLRTGPNVSDSDRFECVSYTDAEVLVLGVLGKAAGAWDTAPQGRPHVELARTPNRAGRPTGVVPGRINLDRRLGGYDGMVGLYQRTAKMMALEAVAVEQDVFADQWLVARPNETPAVIQVADGRRGVLGVVRGGDIVSKHSPPGYKTTETLAMLERAQRLEGGVPAEFGGESATNVRTGRRGDAILSAVVDFPVQEAQRIFEVSLEAENEAAAAVAKGYFGSQPKSFYVSWKGAHGIVDYIPNRDFTSTANTVTYAHAGADINNLVIGLGQRIGTRTISTQTAMEIDPLVDDPEGEHQRIVGEQLESAVLASVANAAATGAMDLTDLNAIYEQVVTGRKSLIDAVKAAHDAAQQRQAAVAAPGVPPAPGTPPTQAGLNAAPPGTVAPTPNEQGLAQLVGALRGGAKGAA